MENNEFSAILEFASSNPGLCSLLVVCGLIWLCMSFISCVGDFVCIVIKSIKKVKNVD